MADVRKKRVDQTEVSRQYTEQEVQNLLIDDLMKRAKVPSGSVFCKTRLYVESKDGSTGPYRVYNVEFHVVGELGVDEGD